MNLEDPAVAQNLRELAQALSATNDTALVISFLESLLTPAEQADIASRWALVKALSEGIPQREIARELGVSLCKITRGSKELKKEDSSFAKMLALASHLKSKKA